MFRCLKKLYLQTQKQITRSSQLHNIKGINSILIRRGKSGAKSTYLRTFTCICVCNNLNELQSFVLYICTFAWNVENDAKIKWNCRISCKIYPFHGFVEMKRERTKWAHSKSTNKRKDENLIRRQSLQKVFFFA